MWRSSPHESASTIANIRNGHTAAPCVSAQTRATSIRAISRRPPVASTLLRVSVTWLLSCWDDGTVHPCDGREHLRLQFRELVREPVIGRRDHDHPLGRFRGTEEASPTGLGNVLVRA